MRKPSAIASVSRLSVLFLVRIGTYHLGTSICLASLGLITLRCRASPLATPLNETQKERFKMAASTPIARSKTAALARVLDNVPRGYCKYTSGTVKAEKAEALAKKLHLAYGIGATPAQRITRRKNGEASAILVMYWPENAERVEWLMLTTPGDGPVTAQERLQDVERKPRLSWLGYELARHTDRGKVSWTWRRPRAEMADHYTVLTDLLNKHHQGAVLEALQRIANQPGFHGVRTQSWALCQYARSRGFEGETPFLFFVQKVSHGDRLTL